MGELRPWHYIYVYSIESRMIMSSRWQDGPCGGGFGASLAVFCDLRLKGHIEERRQVSKPLV